MKHTKCYTVGHENALSRLPERGVPDSISHNIKHLPANQFANESSALQKPQSLSDDESDISDDGIEDRLQDECDNEGSVSDTGSGESEGDENHQDSFVVTLDESAVVDVDGFDISDSDLLQSAFTNAAAASLEERYCINRGNNIVNEYARRDEFGNEDSGTPDNPNHLMGTFPFLFPYGVGGFETKREVRVSYAEHAQWALRYAGGRFSKDVTFLAQLFNILQKRQVCLGAELQIKREDFKRNEKSINAVTTAALKKATEEEKTGNPPSDRGVRALQAFVKATRKHVMGTDEHRMSNRSKIFGMSVMLNPANIWMTITCNDVDDPIVQIFSGAEVHMDHFDASQGPSKEERARNSTGDAFATTKFFFRMMSLILEDLLGIKVTARGITERQRGIFGIVEGYAGMVEAQGRGSLHLHMLLWLRGSPSYSEMDDLLKDEGYRQRLEAFIARNIRAHVPGLNAEYLSKETAQERKLHKHRASAYARPVDPSMPGFESVRDSMQFSLVRSVQLHKCTAGVCVVPDKYGHMKCKRRAPWELSAKDVVYESGLWYPEREHGYLNSWNPIILFATRSNNDIKLLTNGRDTCHVTFYTTKYATKPQARSHHATALLGSRMAYVKHSMTDENDMRKKNKKLLSQCANTLNRGQELSSQQMVAYIMGHGDRLLSHRVVPIYLSGALWVLENSFEEFYKKRTIVVTESGRGREEISRNEDDNSNVNEAFSSYCLRMTPKGLQVKSQLSDYIWRGQRLDRLSFLSFMLESYEPYNSNYNETTNRHERVPYLSSSPFHTDRVRIMRNVESEMMPDFLGSWIPRGDREEGYDFYCAAVLMLLKPWRQLQDLKDLSCTWPEALNTFIEGAKPLERRIIDNFQFYYRSIDKASQKAQDEAQHAAQHNPTSCVDVDFNECYAVPGVHFKTNNHVEFDLDAVADFAEAAGEAFHGNQAVIIGEDIGFFTSEPDEWETCPNQVFERASMYLLTRNFHWQECIDKFQKTDEILPTGCTPFSPVTVSEVSRTTIPTASTVQCDIGPSKDTDSEAAVLSLFPTLSSDQQRACGTVLNHLNRHLSGKDQDPLYMLICGSGGVGKSMVIKTIERIFEMKNARSLLALTATSGVAASNIGGNTVHYWAGLPIITPKTTNFAIKSSRPIKERRQKNIEGKRYLIIDEMSMLCQELLGMVSEVTSDFSIKDKISKETQPFGGELSVILIGDFHQFPPPGRANIALYKSLPGKSCLAHKGFSIFQNFKTVVLLTEQKRVVDRGWSEILERVRYGNCTAKDIREIHSLVLTNQGSDHPDFNSSPWNEAVLVTPRHGVRKKWNDASVKKYARANRKQLLVCYAEHTFHNGDELEKEKHSDILIALAQEDKHLSKKLSRKIYLCTGLRILLTWNIRVSADLANGTVGTITDIFLDPREPPIPSGLSVHRLSYPPRLILFRPDRCNLPTLPGLPPGVVPIQPTVDKVTIRLKDGSTKGISRRQYPITPGYSFTDYKSQGQTIRPVILDLRKPPSGILSQFNVYVALSRGVSREFTRILSEPENELFTTPVEDDLYEYDKFLKDANDKSTTKA